MALARDLKTTAEVLIRFGPRLPGLVEDLLTQQLNGPVAPPKRRSTGWIWGLAGIVLGAVGTGVVLMALAFAL